MNTTTLQPAGHGTLIGSLPVDDYQQALDLILAHTPAIPLWPQLPGNPDEGGMLRQFCEGFPGFCEEEGRTFFKTSDEDFAEKQLAFFEDYLAVSEDPEQLLDSRFASSETRVPGIYRLRERLQSAPPAELAAVKGQITGPFTLLTGLKDENKQDAWYDPTIHEMVVKGLAMRAAWQARYLSAIGIPVIVFLDEPALAGLGSSAYISVSLDEIGNDLNEVIGAVHQHGAQTGVHVCANTDWDFMLKLDLDILSFDAYSFFDRLVASKDALYRFLERQGTIAWGLIPTADEDQIFAESAEGLAARWEEQAQQLVNEQWDMVGLLNRTLITPSCGTGSLGREAAERVLELTGKVSAILRGKYL
ncbi:MAG: hypothetical protein U5J62_03260 [Desulfurivibrio sp.]|nr:hypothetical protein [Desulfurivibrio sp.]